jgi:hypothetical protein
MPVRVGLVFFKITYWENAFQPYKVKTLNDLFFLYLSISIIIHYMTGTILPAIDDHESKINSIATWLGFVLTGQS